MKKTLFSLMLFAFSMGAMADNVMTKLDDGTYVVRTATIATRVAIARPRQ